MSNYFTVVFKVSDEEAFDAERSALVDRLSADEDKASGATVTALSCDHEIRRLELVEQAAELAGDDDLRRAISEIASRINVGDMKSYEEALDRP